MTGSTESCSALATLTVSALTLEKDPVLALLGKLASRHQLKVDVKKGKKAAPTELKVLNHTVPLKQRAAIVRSLCGMSLCNALDRSNGLLGACSGAGSGEAAMVMAGICSWMSVASSLDHPSTNDANVFLGHLDSHLETRAFLTGSAAATSTVADLDLAVAMLRSNKFAVVENRDPYDGHRNVQRWLRQCYADFVRLTRGTGIAIPLLPVPVPGPKLPIFFYSFDESAMPKENSKTKPAASEKQQQPQDAKNKKNEEKKKKPNSQTAPAASNKNKGGSGGAAASFDVTALDIRVGKITKIWPHPEADKLYCEEIDLGEEGGPRQIASGLRPFYDKPEEQLLGKMVIVLANLKKRNLVGFPSHGMVMCSSNSDHTKVEIVVPPEGSKIGERVVFDNTDEKKEPEPENKMAKKKIFDKISPDLKTNADGVVIWKDDATAAKTSGGILKGMPNGQVA